MPKQKRLQAVRQKPNEDRSEFLERIYQAYSQYFDIDPPAAENSRMISPESTLDIRNELQKLGGVMSMPHTQLVHIAYEVYNSCEYQKAKDAAVSLNQIKE